VSDAFQAQRRHPEFATVYENTLQHISAEFSILQVLLHEDAVASLIAVLETFSAAVEKSKVTSVGARKTQKGRLSSTLSLASISSAVNKPTGSKGLVVRVMFLFSESSRLQKCNLLCYVSNNYCVMTVICNDTYL